MTKPIATTERVSDTELVVTHHFDAPPHLVFEAWTKAELMQRWWVPKSFGMTMLSCEIDARTGGTYRFVFAHPSFEHPLAFHGRYLEVVPNSCIVWTNEESADGSVTTVTFEDLGGKTRQVLHEKYPSKEAAEEAVASGSMSGYPEQFDALGELLAGG
jgi:uncharacterized protein YndB with AHSA1/START domain